jgi:hypothetical protein
LETATIIPIVEKSFVQKQTDRDIYYSTINKNHANQVVPLDTEININKGVNHGPQN